jgi:hypothetical protein
MDVEEKNFTRSLTEQSYSKLKVTCVKENSLFVDSIFPATDASLFGETKKIEDVIVWKRPSVANFVPNIHTI